MSSLNLTFTLHCHGYTEAFEDPDWRIKTLLYWTNWDTFKVHFCSLIFCCFFFKLKSLEARNFNVRPGLCGKVSDSATLCVFAECSPSLSSSCRAKEEPTCMSSRTGVAALWPTSARTSTTHCIHMWAISYTDFSWSLMDGAFDQNFSEWLIGAILQTRLISL